MKKAAKKKIFLSAVTAAVMSFSACGSIVTQSHTKTADIRFSWWGTDTRNEYTLEAIDIFREDNDIIVNTEYGEYQGFAQRMDVDMMSNSEADVMQMNYSWLYQYSPDGNGFYDLNQLGEYINLDNFSEDILSYGTINGKLNGIPISMNAITFFYNRSLYDMYGLALPETWDDLFNAAEKMKSDGVYPVEFGEKSFWLACVAYCEQVTGQPMFVENKFSYDETQLQIMLEFYQKIVDSKVAPPHSEFNRDDLAACRTGGISGWISDGGYTCSDAEKAGLYITVGDYPQTDSLTSTGWYKKPTSLYSIKKDTENPQAAAKLVDFLLNSEEMAVLQGSEKGIPDSNAALEVLESRDLLKGIELSATKKMNRSKNLTLMCPDMENQELINAFMDSCDDISYDMINCEQAARTLMSKIEKIESLPKSL